LFVNAASWGLLITGKLVATHNEAGMNSLKGLIGKGVSRSSARASTWRCA
jgi:RHH-type proline utilization regulon transcriptional repressor/proline dehydrogenase/delta 1-pyrroline-5-carboxylate dehydrogenase